MSVVFTNFILEVFLMRENPMPAANIHDTAEKVGTILERLDLPLMEYGEILGIWLMWGAHKFKPNREFVRSCVRRNQFAIVSQVILTCLRPVLKDLGVHLDPTDPNSLDKAAFWCLIWSFINVQACFSCIVPLWYLVDPMTLPTAEAQTTKRLRQFHWFIIVLVIGGLQGIAHIVLANYYPFDYMGYGVPCMWMMYHEIAFDTTWHLIAAIIAIRAWMPPFHWSLSGSHENDETINSYNSAADMYDGSYEKVQDLLKAATISSYASQSDDTIRELFSAKKAAQISKGELPTTDTSVPTKANVGAAKPQVQHVDVTC